MEFTAEQQPAIASSAPKLKLVAFAGTGKTTTLVGYAHAHPQDRILYLCFNKSVEIEARKKFPTNTTCKTSHGLAYPLYGNRYRHKLGNLRLMDISRALNTQNWEVVRPVQETLNNFMASADPAIALHHCPAKLLVTERHRRAAATIVQLAERMWSLMLDENNSVPAPHDAYLKGFALSQPDLSSRFDVILLDEAQDANPLLAGLVAQQAACGVRVVVCGDGHQQLYRFRGSVDALDASWLDDAETHYLTQSFRFGHGVAHVANMVLKFLGETRVLKGLGPDARVSKSLPADLEHRAILCRTVSGVIENALALEGKGEKIFWIGGIEGYQLQALEDLHAFSKGRQDLVKGKALLKTFRDYAHYREVAEQSGDAEMSRSIKIVEQYKANLPALFAKLRANEQRDELDATVTLSTAHRAKGLEWEAVQLADDFSLKPFDSQNEKDQWADEMNLLYVACTRAMRHLAVNAVMLEIMQEFVDRRDGRKPDLPLVFNGKARS